MKNNIDLQKYFISNGEFDGINYILYLNLKDIINTIDTTDIIAAYYNPLKKRILLLLSNYNDTKQIFIPIESFKKKIQKRILNAIVAR